VGGQDIDEEMLGTMRASNPPAPGPPYVAARELQQTDVVARVRIERPQLRIAPNAMGRKNWTLSPLPVCQDHDAVNSRFARSSGDI